MNFSSRLRAHRGTLVILAISMMAFSFLAHEDRSARHAAGIDDTCAWFQMVNRQFPMNRCFSLEEFSDFIHRQPPLDGRRQGRSDDERARACEAIRNTEASSSDQPRRGADYVFSLLQKPACDTGGDNPAEER